jgi:hypothetical protein
MTRDAKREYVAPQLECIDLNKLGEQKRQTRPKWKFWVAQSEPPVSTSNVAGGTTFGRRLPPRDGRRR